MGDADKEAERVVVDGLSMAKRKRPSTKRPSGEAAMWVTLEEWKRRVVVEDLTGWKLK